MFFRTHYPVLRVCPEEGSTGIWAPADPLGRAACVMVAYDALALPYRLIERFVAWQSRYDAEYLPHSADAGQALPGDDWWEGIHQEQADLAQALHARVGGWVQWDDGKHIWTVGKTHPDIDFRKLWRGFFRAA